MTTSVMDVLDGNGAAQTIAVEVASGTGAFSAHSVPEVGGAPVSGTNPMPVQGKTNAPAGVTGSLTLVAANTSQSLQNANSVPFTVTLINPISAADQGISAAEEIWVNVTGGTAAASGGGSSIPLYPGQSITVGPQFAAITWIAATTGHKISGFACM